MNDHQKTKAQLIAELNDFRDRHENCEYRLRQKTNEKRLLQDLIDKNPLSIQIVDKDGFTVLANPAHGKLFLAIPKKNYSIFKDSQLIKQGLDEYFERLKNGEEVKFPDTTYNAHLLDPTYQDNPVNIKVLGFPIFDYENNAERFVIIHEDISKRKKMETDLEEKNRQLNQLTEYLNKIREEERENLSSEIHDTFSTALAAITRRMTDMKEHTRDIKTIEMIDYLLNITGDARNLVHKIIAEMRTDKVKNLGLHTAIKAYARYLEENHTIKIKVDADETKDIDQDLAHKLYRIVQESLINVVQHSQATKAFVTLKKKNGSLMLSISDNGMGLSADEIDLTKNHGIYFMKKRIENLGGTFSISGKKNKGSIIKIDIAAVTKTNL